VTCTPRSHGEGKNWRVRTKKTMLIINTIIFFRVKIGRGWNSRQCILEDSNLTECYDIRFEVFIVVSMEIISFWTEVLKQKFPLVTFKI
jgi:hypothetical protein